MIGAAILLTSAIIGAARSLADEPNRLAINKLAEMTALVRHSEDCPDVPRPWATAYVMLLMMAPPMEEQVEAQERKMLALRTKIGQAKWCQLYSAEMEEAYLVYQQVLGCTQPRFRESGIKTAIAAAVLVWLHRSDAPSKTLIAVANQLDSDTDTICSMAGAIHGAFAQNELTWPLQDRSYIQQEAERLGKISVGKPQDSFAYPDVSHWSPPTNQSSAVGRLEDGFAISGLGPIQVTSEEYSTANSIWQWMELPFGQKVLAKRKRVVRNKIEHEQLPGDRRTYQPLHENRSAPDPTKGRQTEFLPFESLDMQDKSDRKSARPTRSLTASTKANPNELDRMTDEVIQANFDGRTLGRLLNEYIDRIGSIEGALAFASIIAKAKITRRKRRG